MDFCTVGCIHTPGIRWKALSVDFAMSEDFHPSGKLRSQSPGCGFHHKALLTATPPPKTLSLILESYLQIRAYIDLTTYQPAMTPVSSHATPLPSAQIWLKSPGTSKRVRFVPCSHDGFMVPPHFPLEGGPFSRSNTVLPASLNRSAIGMPPAPEPITI